MQPRMTLVAISTVRLSQRSTYTPARTPNTTDGMISVRMARLSWVLEWLERCTSTTMPYQIAFWAVWLMACANHSSRKSRLRQMDDSSKRARARRLAWSSSVDDTGSGATTPTGAWRWLVWRDMPLNPRRPSGRPAPPATGMSSVVVRTSCAARARGAGSARSAARCRPPGAPPSSRCRRTGAPSSGGRHRRHGPQRIWRCSWVPRRDVAHVATVAARAGRVDRRAQALGLGPRGGLPIGPSAGVQDAAAGVDDGARTVLIDARLDGLLEVTCLCPNTWQQDRDPRR